MPRIVSLTSRSAALTLALAAPVAVIAADAPTPLAGNKPCSYPPRAREEQVGGAVRFLAAVLADGSVSSVEIRSVPAPNLGFEESVRACVGEWRFDAVSSAYQPPRVYDGRVSFHRAPAEETFVRSRLEELAAAWNARDQTTVEALAVRPDEAAGDPKAGESPLFDRMQRLTREGAGRLLLAEDVDLFWFLSADALKIRQRYAAVPQEAAGEPAEPPARTLAFEAVLMKGPRGWRFAALAAAPPQQPPAAAPPLQAPVRVGEIREPKKLKNVLPVYPESARQAGIQGVVILEATVSPEGKVTSLKVLRGIPLLDHAAMDAVRQWVYTPTLLKGEAVPVIMTVTVNFTLSGVELPPVFR